MSDTDIPSTPLHWGLYQSLEQDFLRLARFIEVNTNQFNVYSLELTRLLLSLGAEIDSVAKALCHKLDTSSTPNKITQYQPIISTGFSAFSDTEVQFTHYGFCLKPWQGWTVSNSPNWWRHHNKVKHNRQLNFEHGNLGNVANALAALFILCVHLYKDEFEKGMICPSPQLLFLNTPAKGYVVVTDIGMMTTGFQLPPP
ncbi:hypothetical protein KW505_14400 [Vibrio fluvialis]|nr:hypothetical protein [Vibrio fluvialis]MBY8180894.1 hypothetical protein [Vibrio fluvialis]